MGVRELRTDPDADVVARIEDWLGRAKAGELVAVGLVGVTKGGGIAYTFVGQGIFRLLAAASMLEHVIRKYIDEDM